MARLLLQRLHGHARTQGERIALRQIACPNGVDRCLNYAQLDAAVLDLARRIAQVTPPGGVVLVAFPNQVECVVAFLAALQAGAVAFPIYPQISRGELESILQRSPATVLIGAGEAATIARELGLATMACAEWTQGNPDSDATRHHHGEERASQAEACGSLVKQPSARFSEPIQTSWSLDAVGGAELRLMSSGTTGLPKIVRRSAAAIDAVAANVCAGVRLTSRDVVLGLAPICHSYGVESCLIAPIFAGAAVHLIDRFDARLILDQLVGGGITVFPGVPSVYERIASFGAGGTELTTLRCAYSAGAPLPRGVFEAFERRFGVRIGQLYGSTELGAITFNDPNDSDFERTSVGAGMNGVTMRILDPTSLDVHHPLGVGAEGEVAAAAPSMLDGYAGEFESPLIDGFILTGDLGRLDERGRLTITGRRKLLIDVGGFKVNPLEVEAVLSLHEAVRECVVVPVAVTDTIARLKAIVVPRVEGGTISIEELRAFVRERLSRPKVPRIVELRAELPKSPTGKVLRHLL